MVRTKKYRIKSNIRKKTLKRDKIKSRTRKKNNNKKKRKRNTQKGGLNSEVIGDYTITPIGNGFMVYKKIETRKGKETIKVNSTYVYVEGNDIKIKKFFQVTRGDDKKTWQNSNKGTLVDDKPGWKYYEKLGPHNYAGFMNGLVMFDCPDDSKSGRNKKKCKVNMKEHFNTGEENYNNLPSEVKDRLDELISSSSTNTEKKVNVAISNSNSKSSENESSSKSKNNENKSQVNESNVNLQELFNNISASSNKKWIPHKKKDCHNALIELANLDKTKNLTLDKVLELRRKLFVCLPEEANKQLFTSLAASVIEEKSNTDIDTDKPEDVIKKIKKLLDESFKKKIDVSISSDGADKGYTFILKEGDNVNDSKKYHFIFGTNKEKLYYVEFPGSAFKANIYEVNEVIGENPYDKFDNYTDATFKSSASANDNANDKNIMKTFIGDQPISDIKLNDLTLLSPKLVESNERMKNPSSRKKVTFINQAHVIQSNNSTKLT